MDRHLTARVPGSACAARVMETRSKTRAVAELLAATAILLSYIWLWQGAFAGDFVVCLALFLGVTIASHRHRGESARDLGFRVDNLSAAGRLVFTFVGPLIAGVVVIGVVFGLHREPPILRLGTRLVLMPLFGVAQEYGLLGFYYRRWREALPGEAASMLAAAGVFTILHLPNPPVMVMTFLASLGACWLYRRAPNLWVLGVAHGLLSITVAMFLAELLTSGLKVGARALS